MYHSEHHVFAQIIVTQQKLQGAVTMDLVPQKLEPELQESSLIV